jgi:hypothetical protein
LASSQTHSASFRDPSGFLFTRDGTLYRQVNPAYQAAYDHMMASGLYEELTRTGRLIPHEEIDLEPAETDTAYKILRPEPLVFISYPYEWSFSQLKDAALATLAVQKRAFEKGMVLKDSSAYNIQFHRGRPVLIDTLSFDIYQEGDPWVAYRQFCQHFLAPLALMSLNDIRLSQLLRVYIDGIPLDLASTLLPRRTRLNFGLLSHIHLHASAQRRYADKAIDPAVTRRKMSRLSFLGLIDGLKSAVEKLKWEPGGTEWSDYYDATAGHYSSAAQEHKLATLSAFLDRVQPRTVWDLGANTGLFSRQASDRDIFTVAWDIDPGAVEQNYRQVVARKERHLLPLVLDLTNPSPGIGWNNQERMALLERGPADAVFALALIHHLAIGNNVPLSRLADFFKGAGRNLMIEFVPKADSQVQLLLASREDIFPDYTVAAFEAAFSRHFEIRETVDVQDTPRRLYRMEAR